MANCEVWNNLYGLKGEWEICWDIPIKQPAGVFYKYPNEPQQFIEGATHWECERDSQPTYLLTVRVWHYSYCPNEDGSRTSEVRSVDFEIIVYGDVIEVIPGVLGDSFGNAADGQFYAGYSFFVRTDISVYGGTAEPSTGTTILVTGSYPGVDIRTNVDPPGTNGSPLNGQNCQTKTTHVKLIEQIYLGETLGIFPDKTFKVYQNDQEVFSRYDPVNCPAAWLVKEKCYYSGDVKSRKVPYNNQSNAYLVKVFGTANGEKCVSVFKRGIIGSNPGAGLGVQSSILLLYVCSPPGCELYPKVTTAPGDGGRKCPEGTCTVECGDSVCCYDENGNLVDSFSKTLGIDSVKPDQPSNRQQYINQNYGNPQIGSDPQTTMNIYLYG